MRYIIYIFLITISIFSNASNFASMYIKNGSDLISDTLPTKNELQITGYSTMNLSNWTLSSDKLTAGSNASGNYLLKYSISFAASEGLWTIKVYKNSTNISEIKGKRKIASSDIGNISASGLISVSSGDEIKIVAVCDTNATEFTVTYSQVSITPLENISKLYIGEMYIYNNTNTRQITNLKWTDVEYFSEGNNNGFEFNSKNNSLITPDDGEGFYNLSFSTSFNASSANTIYFALAINGAIQDTLILARKISGSKDCGNAVFCGIIHLNNNDTISIIAKSKTSILNLQVYYANLNIYKIKTLKSSTEYGSMYISNNTDSLNLETFWKSEKQFTSGSMNNNWTSDTSKLIPNNSSLGFYYLNFNMAITYADSDEAVNTYVYPIIGIFINGVLQRNLVFERKLQKKDNHDYGSIAGSGFVRINSTNDVIEVKLKEAKGKDILTVDANLSLYRISENANLPVKLTYFKAKPQNNGNLLEWKTSIEINNKQFEIYASTDANSFEKIGAINGAGNSNKTISYSWLDDRKINKIIYYKLKQIDYDNNYVYSKIIAVKSIISKNKDISVSTCNNNLNISINSITEQLAKIILYDINGKIVYSSDIEINENLNSYSLNLSYLQTGIYIINIISENSNIFTKKLIMNN